MWNFKTGDLIAKLHPSNGYPLQIGLIIQEDEESFTVKWTSFNKNFFMAKEGDIFQELNNSFLLGTDRIWRLDRRTNLSLLNSNYRDVQVLKIAAAAEVDHSTT
jgi:hypothetical protein